MVVAKSLIQLNGSLKREGKLITVNHSGSGGWLLVLRFDELGQESEVTGKGEDVKNGWQIVEDDHFIGQ